MIGETTFMSIEKKDYKTQIIVAVIGALGALGAALIISWGAVYSRSNRDEESKKYTVDQPEHLKTTKNHVSVQEKELDPSQLAHSSQPSERECEDGSFLFEKKKFIENKPVLFCKGKVSVTVRRSDVAGCDMYVYQFFSEKKEEKIRLVKGDPLAFSVLGVKYIFHFIDGAYRDYSTVSSYGK